MARDSYFRVGFDGKWQKDFDFEADAIEWAREVSLTGRTTCVIEQRGHHALFREGFPAGEAAGDTAFSAKERTEKPKGFGTVGVAASALPCRRTLRFWGRLLLGALHLVSTRARSQLGSD